MNRSLLTLILGLLLTAGIVAAQDTPATPATPTAPAVPATPDVTPATPSAAGQTAATTSNADLITTLEAHPEFSEFFSFLTETELLGMLSEGGGPFTVFVPTNEAFASHQAELASLESDPAQLADFLEDYIVRGSVTADELMTMTTLDPLGDTALSVSVGPATGEAPAGDEAAGEQAAGAETRITNVEVDGVTLSEAPISTTDGSLIYPTDDLFASTVPAGSAPATPEAPATPTPATPATPTPETPATPATPVTPSNPTPATPADPAMPGGDSTDTP